MCAVVTNVFGFQLSFHLCAFSSNYRANSLSCTVRSTVLHLEVKSEEVLYTRLLILDIWLFQLYFCSYKCWKSWFNGPINVDDLVLWAFYFFNLTVNIVWALWLNKREDIDRTVLLYRNVHHRMWAVVTEVLGLWLVFISAWSCLTCGTSLLGCSCRFTALHLEVWREKM